MERSKMSSRKRSRAKNVLRGFAKGFAACALVVIAVVAVGVAVRSFTAEEKAVSHAVPLMPAAVQKVEEPANADSEMGGKYYGLCKKNSIHSIRDFQKVVRNDPVLEAHFAGFNWDTARIARQEKDVWTYVSYRKGDVIWRTTKAVRLPKGDGYVTDGTRVVRTFCCNDYVIAPAPTGAGPAAPVERVDAPPRRTERSVEEVPPLASGAPVGEEPGVVPAYHDVPAVYSGPPIFYSNPPGTPPFVPYSSPKHNPPPKPPPHPTPVPEPATFVLVGVGAGMLGFFGLLRRKRTRPL